MLRWTRERRRAGLPLGALTILLAFQGIASGQAITEFPLPSLSPPGAITTGPDGNLWFTEFIILEQVYYSQIGRITPSGAISEFSTSGLDLGDITAGPDGNLWFTESDVGTTGMAAIGRMTPAGVFTEYRLEHGKTPSGITLGSDGNVWFTEPKGNTISRITTAGIITEFPVPTPVSGPGSITAGPDGNLWFTESAANKIGQITPSGVITEFSIPTGAGSPGSITAGPDGNLWFIESEGNKIGRITMAGTITEFSLPTGTSWLARITAGHDGNLWFTEPEGNKIGRITTAGVVTEFPIPTAGSHPVEITAGPDGNVWFTELAGNKIGRITVDRSTALETRILAVVGSTPGANGTLFKTSVQLHSASSTPIAGRIVFHPSGAPGSDSDPALFYSLAPGQTQSFADLLPVMGRSGIGSADIEVTSRSAPVATVRVFNDAGPSGTTGFTEEPMRAEEALGAGQQGVLLIPSDLAAFRFNLGVRTLDSGASMTLTVRDASGAIVATAPRSFPATYHLQREASEFLEGVTLPAGGSVTVAVESGSAILYGATVDNRTGDPSLQIARRAL